MVNYLRMATYLVHQFNDDQLQYLIEVIYLIDTSAQIFKCPLLHFVCNVCVVCSVCMGVCAMCVCICGRVHVCVCACATSVCEKCVCVYASEAKVKKKIHKQHQFKKMARGVGKIANSLEN